MRSFIACRIVFVLVTVSVATTCGLSAAVTTKLVLIEDWGDWMHALAIGQVVLWVAIAWVFALDRRYRCAARASTPTGPDPSESVDSRHELDDEVAAYLRSLQARIMSAYATAMERMNDVVKDAILDWRPGGSDAETDPEVKLRPLDRQQFAERLSPRLAEVLGYIADTVSAPRTDVDLANAESDVGRFLHELRWDALAVALELRSPGDAYQPVPELAPPRRPRRLPPERPAAPTTGNWAKKYRRMKALGY